MKSISAKTPVGAGAVTRACTKLALALVAGAVVGAGAAASASALPQREGKPAGDNQQQPGQPGNQANPAQPSQPGSGPNGGNQQPGTELTINILVVEIAGGNAYIQPGEQAGLRPGQEVLIGNRRFRLVTVARDHAVIRLDDRSQVSEGDTGRAVVRVRDPNQPVLPPPTPLADFTGQWDEPVIPASQQTPVRVPLGSGSDTGAYRVLLRAGASTTVAGGLSHAHLRLGAAVHAEPWRDVPFGFDADIALALWLGDGASADLGANSRPALSVRELQLRYGDRYRPYIGLGRLRYAASTLGLLDGVRLTTPRFNGSQVSVFGGGVPDTLDGSLSFEHRRFGVEATFDNPDVPWEPFITVVAHGSLFDGDLDERRMSGFASFRNGPLSVNGHAEVSFFEEDNPWGVSFLEITAAGVDATVRSGNNRVGARLDIRQPERSRWLASLLPPAWLCTAEPQPPPDPADPMPAPEPCSDTRDYRYTAAIDGEAELGQVIVSGGGSIIGISNGDDIETMSVFGDIRVLELFGPYRGHVGGYVSMNPLLDATSFRLGGGGPMPFLPNLDLALYYRPTVISYNAALENFLDHRVGLDALYSPMPRLDVALTVEGFFGDDNNGLGAFATAVWRPQI